MVGPGKPLRQFTTCGGCRRRVQLFEVQPSPLVPGALPVVGFFCPICDDTTNR